MYGLGGINKMNNPPFKVGDVVTVNGRDEATIIKIDHPVREDNNFPGALVEFNDKNLVPPQMGVPYRSMSKLTAPKLPVGQPTSGPGVPRSGKVVTGKKAVVTLNGNPIGVVLPEDVTYDVGQDPWCQGMSPSKECVHDWVLTKGFSFDKLICSKCDEKKRYNPMEG